jgi:2,4-dienoyl-CoA reductase-like NADH-dependent reductase (Old Yellow Enzyme family)
LIITGACFVEISGRAFDGQWGCEDDSRIDDLRVMADALHAGGAKTYLQIHHGGRACPSRLCGETVAPSVIAPDKPDGPTPRAMTASEVDETIIAFGEAARRAKEAGFDGVEIHGANGYLLQQFVSPLTNFRDDKWGQDRLAFALAVADAALQHAGEGFEVGYRLSPEEAKPEGLAMTDTLKLVEALCQRNLSYIHLSTQNAKMASEKDCNIHPFIRRVADQIKGRIPLIGVGSIQSVEDAQWLLKNGADLVAFGRMAITDPEWPQHAQSGEPIHTKYPRSNGVQTLTVPAGLNQRMVNVPGWVELE